MQSTIRSLMLAIPSALKRDRTPWNWCLRRSSVALLLLALGLKSFLLFATAIIFLGTSLFELHLQEMKNRFVWRLMRLERLWRDEAWSNRKRVQTAIIILVSILLLWSLAVGDIALILLAIAGMVLLGVEAAQHAVSLALEEDENEESANADRLNTNEETEENTSPEDSWLQ